MRIELLYFDGCPGHAELRDRLPRLLERAGVDARIEEHRIDSGDSARRERFLGSPTLRVDGHDIDPTADSRHDYGLRCRLYPSEDGLQRTPPDAWVTEALRGAARLHR
ncbi:MAG TPA: hypothetical protein VNY34_02670 [Solirubrobacteraceae bacterium]|jgi:hypothetical protein|nr:hypothetical protein [Solirubrobacteraceae bacterium]